MCRQPPHLRHGTAAPMQSSVPKDNHTIFFSPHDCPAPLHSTAAFPEISTIGAYTENSSVISCPICGRKQLTAPMQSSVPKDNHTIFFSPHDCPAPLHSTAAFPEISTIGASPENSSVISRPICGREQLTAPPCKAVCQRITTQSFSLRATVLHRLTQLPPFPRFPPSACTLKIHQPSTAPSAAGNSCPPCKAVCLMITTPSFPLRATVLHRFTQLPSARKSLS